MAWPGNEILQFHDFPGFHDPYEVSLALNWTNLSNCLFVISPSILANQKSQPITNCNRKYFRCFKSRVMSPTTYQKSRRIEEQEDKKITSLMW